mgnify:CR=1 FL=1|jgi:hypothetical protein
MNKIEYEKDNEVLTLIMALEAHILAEEYEEAMLLMAKCRKNIYKRRDDESTL